MERIDVAWEKVHKLSKEIVKQIQDAGKEYEMILTLPKGGLVPSYFIAELLNLPVETINVQSYSGEERGELVVREQEGFSKNISESSKVLIIDDIYDSGKTIRYIQERFPDVDVACLFARYPDHTATFVGEILNHEQYIYFPWEDKMD